MKSAIHAHTHVRWIENARRKRHIALDNNIVAANSKLDKAAATLDRARKRLQQALHPASQSRAVYTAERIERLKLSLARAETAHGKAVHSSAKFLGSGSGSVRIQLPEFIEGASAS